MCIVNIKIITLIFFLSNKKNLYLALIPSIYISPSIVWISIARMILKLDSDILGSFIYKMISVNPGEVVFCVAWTKNYSDAEFSDNRKKFLKLKPIYTGTYYNEKYDKSMDYRVVII